MRSAEYKYYYGIVDLAPSTRLEILPSLSREERLTHLFVDREGFSLAKSPNTRFYYVSNHSNYPKKLHFILEVKNPAKITLPPEIADLIETYKNFGEGKVTTGVANPTGLDFLAALNRQKMGACRHRVVCFFYEMQRRFPDIPIWALLNDIHAMAEFFYKGHYFKVDLLGYHGDLDITDENHKDRAERSIQLSRSQGTRWIGDYLRKHIVKPGKKSLIELHTLEQVAKCFGLLERLSHKVHIVREPKGLRWIPSNYSVLAVDISSFEGEEIKRLMQIFLPQGACLVCLYIMGGSFVERTEEFLALFTAKVELLPYKTDERMTFPRDRAEREMILSPPVVPAPNTLDLIQRKVLETLWDKKSHIIQCNLQDLKGHAYKPGKNVHIALQDSSQLDLCALYLNEHLPYAYYIDKPEEIRCSSRWIGPSGVLHPGPGGPLHRYITSFENPVIIINFSTFTPEDIVRCNGIIEDNHRDADGTKLPASTCVIGLSVNHPNAYTGKDFTGRFFHKIEVLPFEAHYPQRTSENPTTQIDLLGIEEWKELLTGQWMMRGGTFVRKKGLLEGHTDIEIQNGPWSDRDFVFFWLMHPEYRIKRTTHEPKKKIQWLDRIPAGVQTVFINPSTLGQMEDETALNGAWEYPGWVVRAKGGPLYGHLSSHLSDSQWHRLLTLCDKHDVQLYVSNTPIKPACRLIVSSDVVSSALQQNPEAIVIDASECDNRLVEILDLRWTSEVEFAFEETPGVISKMLGQGKEVIVKGSFSGPLIDALIPLMMQHKKLTLITDTLKGFELFEHLREKPIKATFSPKMPPLMDSVYDERLNAVYRALEKAPHVLIEGATGVGKTTFVQEVLAKQPGIKLFYNIRQWIDCVDEAITPILFIDEVNLQKKSFSLFEGLYHRKKSIVVDGIYYELTPRHRVVFAANPLSYGGERREVPFLVRHNNTVTFTPLSEDHLYESVVKRYGLPEAVAREFLGIYRQNPEFCPRELEMMALVHLAKRFVKKPDLNGFVLTDSRQELFSFMCDFIAVRELKIQTNLKGGLGGIVVEGIPGDGKTHLVEAFLKGQGFKEVLPHEIGNTIQNAFCRLPANMTLEEKRECLLAAFYAGNIIFENEINTSPSLESLRNALLMGFDEQGIASKNRGFMLFATQNPIYFAGRRATPSALKHRVATFVLTPYPQREVFQIVQKKNPQIPEEVIRLLTQNQVSFREILQIVEKGIKHEKILLEPLPEPVEQRGPTCKLYALACVMQWLYQKSPLNFPPTPPARKNKSTFASVRSLAKKDFYSQVGEVYHPQYLVEMAKRYGFTSTRIVESNHQDYCLTLKKLLDQGHAPIVFFDVEMQTGKPIRLQSKQEHAAVCVGYLYNLQGELFFTLLHWGKPWVVNAKELALSANNLSQDRQPETFYKIDGIWRQEGDRLDTSRNDFQNALKAGRYTHKRTGKKSSGTFCNKFVVVG